jgi:hypothetical protein
MPEPVVFISHFKVKEGKLDDLKRLSSQVEAELLTQKPRTIGFLMYLDDAGTEMTEPWRRCGRRPRRRASP